MLQGPGNILHVIAGNPELSTVFQQTCEQHQIFRADKATLGMAFLGPRIGKQQKGPIKTGIHQLIKQRARIIGNDAYIG